MNKYFTKENVAKVASGTVEVGASLLLTAVGVSYVWSVWRSR